VKIDQVGQMFKWGRVREHTASDRPVLFFIYRRKGNQYAKRPSSTWARAFTAVYSSFNFGYPTIHNNKVPRKCAGWYNVLRQIVEKRAIFLFFFAQYQITICAMSKILLTSIWWPEPSNHST